MLSLGSLSAVCKPGMGTLECEKNQNLYGQIDERVYFQEMGGVCRRAAHKNVEVLGRCDTGKLLGASVIKPVVSCGICMG